MKPRSSAILRVSHNAGLLLLGTMVRMLLAFGFVVYAARYLGVAGYGKFALTQYYFELSLSLCATGLCILVTREVAKNRQWLSSHLTAAIAMLVILPRCAAGLLALLARVANYAPDTRTAIYIASAAIIPGALCLLAEAIFVAMEKSEWVAVGIATEGLVRTSLCFAALFMGFGLLSLFIILIATRSAQLTFYALLLARRLPQVERRLQRATVWSLAQEWRVFAAETWVANLYLSLDAVLLSLFHGEAAVGLYDAAWKLIRFGPVVANSFTTAVFPFISRLYVDAQETFQQVSEQSVKYILALVIPAVLCISVFADRIVLLLFDHQYADSASVLRVLAWLLISQFLNPFLSRVLYARGQPRRSLAVGVVGLLAFLSVAFVLIPKFGPVGTAWSALIASYSALSCYILYATAGTDRRSILMMLLRQAAAATILCLTLVFLKDMQLLTMLIACAALYAVLLVALRIVAAGDLKLFQELR